MNLEKLAGSELAFVETFNNVDFGDYESSLRGYYFTGKISTTFKK